MILELSLMAVALVIMTSIYVHQHYVALHGVSTPVQKVKEKIDPIIEDAHAKTNHVLSRFNWRAISLLIHDIFVYVAKFFVRFSTKVHHVSSTVVEKVSQRKENLSKGGAASFYLKQIKDVKNSAEGRE